MPYSVMSQAALGQTAANGIIMHDDFLADLITCLLVCQSTHFQDRPRHLKAEDHGRLRGTAMFAAPEEYVASGESAEVYVHADLSM